MKKTGKQVQTDIRQMLLGSALAEAVSGSVYRNGYRPRDSREEDIIVTFTAGLAEQIQTGVVTVNIYIPDIDSAANGTWVEDGRRTEALEAAAQAWADSLTAKAAGGYKFRLQQTIYTEAAEDIRQHFVVVKLAYEYFGED